MEIYLEILITSNGVFMWHFINSWNKVIRGLLAEDSTIQEIEYL